MTEAERQLRADALRNRERILEAAATVFSEQGLEVSVGEVARLAGVGRGTLFRNFPTKQDLIAAIVSRRIGEAVMIGRELLAGGDPADGAYVFIAELVGRQQRDRALFEGIVGESLTRPEIRDAVTDALAVLDELLDAGKRAGTVRPEVGALDVMMMVKGVCAAASALGDAGLDAVERHVDLICAAISTPAQARPLRGATPTLASLELLRPPGQPGRPGQPGGSEPHDGAGAPAARG
jgi:AcrR family transcriptional regulator